MNTTLPWWYQLIYIRSSSLSNLDSQFLHLIVFYHNEQKKFEFSCHPPLRNVKSYKWNLNISLLWSSYFPNLVLQFLHLIFFTIMNESKVNFQVIFFIKFWITKMMLEYCFKMMLLTQMNFQTIFFGKLVFTSFTFKCVLPHNRDKPSNIPLPASISMFLPSWSETIWIFMPNPLSNVQSYNWRHLNILGQVRLFSFFWNLESQSLHIMSKTLRALQKLDKITDYL